MKAKGSDMIVTNMRIPRRTWELLRQLANERQALEGGRSSVSGVIVDLAEAKKARRRRRTDRTC